MRTRYRFRPMLLTGAFCFLVLCSQSVRAEWSDGFSIAGVDGTVHASATFAGDVWVAGSFGQAGKSTVGNVARWDGTSWQPAGTIEGTVYALEVHEGTLYAGGEASTAVFRDGQWEPWVELASPQSSLIPVVYALHSDGEALFLGGRFESVEGKPHRSLAMWKDGRIEPAGESLGDPSQVFAVTGSELDLFVGGTLSSAGTTEVHSVAHWNGQTWDDLDGGLSGEVYALTQSKEGLVVGGNFLRSGENGIRSIANWTGEIWEPFSTGMRGDSPIVRALAIFQGDLYAGGDFDIAGGTRVNGMARWREGSWRSMSGSVGASGQVRTLTIRGGGLYAGGFFRRIGGQSAYSVAVWNGFWNPLGRPRGMDGPVFDLATRGTSVLAGGDFTRAGQFDAARASVWVDGNWTEQLTYFNDTVLAVAGVGDLIAAAGSFTPAGPPSARHLAIRIDGEAWDSPRGGASAAVHVLGQYQGQLVAGGAFLRAGGRPSQRISQWDGEFWNDFAEGLGDIPFALLEWEGGLLVAGQFVVAGNQPVDYITRWDGQSWQPDFAGWNHPIHHLAVWENQLVAAGEGPEGSGSVQVWQNEQWEELGLGFDGTVYSVVPFQGKLIAGGAFTYADGKPAAGLALWDGLSWSQVPDAVDGGRSIVYDLLVDPLDPELLWLGGDFLRVGEVWSNHVAQWRGPFPSFVWPGDTDNNGRVTARDLLPIAHHWMATGPARSGPSGWSEEPVESWTPAAAGFADADGSGRVDADDLLPLLEYWNHEQPNSDGVSTPTQVEPGTIARLLSETLPSGAAGKAMSEFLQKFLESTTGRETGLRVFYAGRGLVSLHWTKESHRDVRLRIFDVRGRAVRSFSIAKKETGPIHLDWAGEDDRGGKVPSGIYWARLETEGRKLDSTTIAVVR